MAFSLTRHGNREEWILKMVVGSVGAEGTGRRLPSQNASKMTELWSLNRDAQCVFDDALGIGRAVVVTISDSNRRLSRKKRLGESRGCAVWCRIELAELPW